jgi:transposase
MNRIVVGVDIAKRVFQLHWVEPGTSEIVSLQLKREKFLEHFANRVSCVIGMEACGGSQHWARSLQRLGHEVKLMSGRMVKPFVVGNKNDVADARTIWTAVQQPKIKSVAVKSEEQQAVLALHRMREQLVKFRTAQINGLRGLLTEYGEVMPQGRAGIKRDIPGALGRLSDRLPVMVIDTLREQYTRLGELDERIGQIEQRLRQWQREDPASQRIAAIPGVGLLSATAAVATMGDAKAFKSGREFAAWIGLVPRQIGTGGRVRLTGYQQARRYLSSHAADPWRPRGTHAQ